MTQANTEAPEGILLVDKPGGMTSHDVVDRMRRVFRIKRIGHAGTLDPLATGLLILLIGRATKVSQYMMSLDKGYAGTIRLGVSADSQDADGEVTEERPVPELDEAELRRHMEAFLGDQYQTPPMHSARKVGGQPLYKLARKGKSVEREPRVIHVSRFELTGWTPPDVAFEVGSSKGTYIRTLAHDLGERIGCGGHLRALRRTSVGGFSVEDAVGLEAIEAMPPSSLRRKLLPVHRAVPSHVI